MALETEIRQILQEFGVSFKTNSKSFICTCPRCKKEEKLYIRRHDGRFVCWFCAEKDNFQGKPEYALRELTGLGLGDLNKRLYGLNANASSDFRIHINMADFVDEEDDEIVVDNSLQEIVWSPEFEEIDHPNSVQGAAYLEKRGVTIDIARQYNVKYWVPRKRVVFPVMEGSRLYGYQARAIYNTDPFWDDKRQKMVRPLKIVTSDDLKRDRLLMFSDRLKGTEHAILCEGPLDALHCHLCGGNVAAMGKAVSRNQLELIKNAGISKIYLALDPDAYREAEKICRFFSDFHVYNLQPPSPYKDLGETPMEVVKNMFLSAEPLKPGRIFVYMKRAEIS